jgi:phage terminase small subunit
MSARPKTVLTPRQARFVEEYLKDLNGTQAVIRAGYSKSGARVTASHLLRLPKVSRAIEAAKAARSEAVGIDSEWVLRKLREVFERVMQEVRPALDRRGRPLKDDDGNVLYRFDAAQANRALELIGKHIGVQAFQENIHVSDSAAVIAALNAGRRRAAGLVIDAEPLPEVEPENGVMAALEAGRRRTALPQLTKKDYRQ